MPVRKSYYPDNLALLEQLITKNDYQIVQENGQRIYAPAKSAGILPPPKGTEIFVGNLPPDLYEEELIPLFSTKGAIYQLRLMVDFYGKNRGYAFISYFTTADAQAAVEDLDKHKIRRRTKIAVSMSVDNRRLFIGNIPRLMTSFDIETYLDTYVDGLVQVILYPEPYDHRRNRGFVFAEFETHRLAAIARRQLCPGNLVIWDHNIYVDWADPLPEVDPKIMKTVTKLFLSNLPTDTHVQELKSILLEFVPSKHLSRVHKTYNYAFVHFDDRKVAEKAFSKLLGCRIGTNVISVEWARPIEFSKSYVMQQTPRNFCRSVPPSRRRQVEEELLKVKRRKMRPILSAANGSGGANSWGRDAGESTRARKFSSGTEKSGSSATGRASPSAAIDAFESWDINPSDLSSSLE